MGVAGDAGGAGVDHVLDARDRQRGLGDVGGQHDAAVLPGMEDLVLLGQREPGEQRQDLGPGQAPVGLHPGAQHLGRVADLALAGEEDQDVPGCLGGELVHGLGDGIERVAVLRLGIGVQLVLVHAVGRVQRPVAQLDGEGAAGDLDDGCRHRFLALGPGRGKVLGEALRVDGGGGDDDLQVRPLGQDPAQVAEQEVDVEAAFVGLVDDDGVVLLQQLVALDLGQQDAVGHHLDLGGPGDLSGEAHVEADVLADLGPQLLGDALGDGASRKAAGLGVPDHPAFAHTQLQEHLGQLGGFAGTGFTSDDDHLVVLDGRHDVIASRGNGKGFGIGNRQGHDDPSLCQRRRRPVLARPPGRARGTVPSISDRSSVSGVCGVNTRLCPRYRLILATLGYQLSVYR